MHRKINASKRAFQKAVPNYNITNNFLACGMVCYYLILSDLRCEAGSVVGWETAKEDFFNGRQW